jgi:type II secretory pathway pseudopilin PulG
MRTRSVRTRGEDGATLIFVIGFMVLVGLVAAGLATQLASSSKTRVALDNARNRQYAADAAITSDMAQVRTNMGNGNALAPCPSSKLTQTLNGVTVQVDCSFSLLSFSGDMLRNATFTACQQQSPAGPCPPSAVIIKAQVHYSAPDPQPPVNSTTISVDKTYVLTWSVKS